MEVFECIRSHRATRWFEPQPLSEEQLTHILEAGRRSGSGKNRQTWQFIVVRDRETLRALSQCGQNTWHLAEAPTVIVIAIEPSSELVTLFDVGRCAQNMMLAAWEIGVGSCIGTLTDQPAARKVLGVPDERLILTSISFGLPARETPEQRQVMTAILSQRGRKPLSELVRYDHW